MNDHVFVFVISMKLSAIFWVSDFTGGNPMSWNRTALSALLAGIILAAALAENAVAQAPIRGPVTGGGGPTPRPPRQEPCWQVAVVSKAALNQRRSIQQQTRQEVLSVCGNSSLSIQQKRQEIQQIHQRERQEIEAIISPTQQEEMRTCQEQRHGVHGGGGGHVGGGGGPCGEMSTGPGTKPHPMEEDEPPSNDTAKPN
jgi:hypothetical protein